MTNGNNDIATRMTKASIQLLAIIVFAAALHAIWYDNSDLLMDRTFPYGDGWRNNVPFPYPNWAVVILDKIGIVIVIATSLIAFFVPRRVRRVREFVLVGLLCFVYLNLRDSIITSLFLKY